MSGEMMPVSGDNVLVSGDQPILIGAGMFSMIQRVQVGRFAGRADLHRCGSVRFGSTGAGLMMRRPCRSSSVRVGLV